MPLDSATTGARSEDFSQPAAEAAASAAVNRRTSCFMASRLSLKWPAASKGSPGPLRASPRRSRDRSAHIFPGRPSLLQEGDLRMVVSTQKAIFTVTLVGLVDLIGCARRDDAQPRHDPSTRAAVAAAASSFTLFESGQVRPLALSPSGKLLFAVNTPDNRLEVFKVRPGGLVHHGSVPVGLEPVAVAAR